MNIDTTLLDDHAVLTLRGEFDTFHCPRFQEEIDDILERDICFIVLNMRLVKFINSTALGAIIRASKMCKVDDGELVLAGPSPFVKDIVNKLGIDQLVPVFDDEEAALKHVTKALNAKDWPTSAPVREEKVLISFPDEKRNARLGGKRSLVGTMSNVDSEKVQFLFDGSRMGITGDQARQLFYQDSQINLKFQVKLIRKGHFEVVAEVQETETATDENVRVTATFKKIKQGERDALAQFAEDMKSLKNQIPGS